MTEQLKPCKVTQSEMALLMRLSDGPSRCASYEFGPGWVALSAVEHNRWAFEALARARELDNAPRSTE